MKTYTPLRGRELMDLVARLDARAQVLGGMLAQSAGVAFFATVIAATRVAFDVARGGPAADYRSSGCTIN